MNLDIIEDDLLVAEDFNDFFEDSLCGYVIANSSGMIIRVNKTLVDWMGVSSAEITGRRISDVLTTGGKIYYETHLWPLLRMQGFFDEVALELMGTNQQKLPVLLNGMERRKEDGTVAFVRFAFIKATDRRIYEQNLKDSKASLEISLANAMEVSKLREQLIAILGHDLKNPLGSIIAGVSILSQSPLGMDELKILEIINRSASRMAELIGNIMDFARTRLGERIIINPKAVNLESTLVQVVDELRGTIPGRTIKTDFELTEPVVCDAPRIAQVFSNLLANAMTHGFADTVVEAKAVSRPGFFELAVCNHGVPISPGQMAMIFEPFTKESNRPSQNGLGLGLYIADQISKAHKGRITVESNSALTCFTFTMGK